MPRVTESGLKMHPPPIFVFSNLPYTHMSTYNASTPDPIPSQLPGKTVAANYDDSGPHEVRLSQVLSGHSYHQPPGLIPLPPWNLKTSLYRPVTSSIPPPISLFYRNACTGANVHFFGLSSPIKLAQFKLIWWPTNFADSSEWSSKNHKAP